jgi:hypothetical protein
MIGQLADIGEVAREELLRNWQERVHVLENAHYKACNAFGRRSLYLGVPATILSTIAGTAVFATMAEQVDVWIRFVIGAISVLVAVLTGLQTFLRFDERSAKHRAAGVEFGILRRELELSWASQRDNGTSDEALRQLKEKIDALYKEAPEIPQSIFDGERAAIQKRNEERENQRPKVPCRGTL